jgi:hypothetical protein
MEQNCYSLKLIYTIPRKLFLTVRLNRLHVPNTFRDRSNYCGFLRTVDNKEAIHFYDLPLVWILFLLYSIHTVNCPLKYTVGKSARNSDTKIIQFQVVMQFIKKLQVTNYTRKLFPICI